MAHHRLDPAAVHRMVRARNGGVARDMSARGQRVLAYQRARVGRDSGDLYRDLHVQWLPPPHFPGVEIGSDLPQATFHRKGHGVIVPKRAKALRFKPKGSQRFIFVKRVGPLKGNPYMDRSLRAARR